MTKTGILVGFLAVFGISFVVNLALYRSDDQVKIVRSVVKSEKPKGWLVTYDGLRGKSTYLWQPKMVYDDMDFDFVTCLADDDHHLDCSGWMEYTIVTEKTLVPTTGLFW